MKKITCLLTCLLTVYSVGAFANLQDTLPECLSSAVLAAKYPMISAEKDLLYPWAWVAKTANIPEFFAGNLYIRVNEATNAESAIKIANEIEKTSSQWQGAIEVKIFQDDEDPEGKYAWNCHYKIDDTHMNLGDDMVMSTPILTK